MNVHDIEIELNEFCPEFHPRARYTPLGIQVRCDWALQYVIDERQPVEHGKQEMIDFLYQHLGKLTVLLRRLEEKL